MVSTRHHPRPFPEPALPPSRSPTKETGTSTPSSPAKTSTPPSPTVDVPAPRKTPAKRTTRKSIADTVIENVTPSTTLARTKSRRRTRSQAQFPRYVHHPASINITWLLISLPLVFWDTAYIFGRPHTMPGGRFHSPIWTPYALYGTVDYMYGWPQWDRHNGFTAAQGALNALETGMYLYYLYVVFSGVAEGWRSGVVDKLWRESTNGRIAVEGPHVAPAVLLCWGGAVMTVSKTVLYWLNEYFSAFENIGHNDFMSLFWLWIVPNGAWLIFPSYTIYTLGKEIISAMHLAGESGEKED